ncbi:hypothetical protein FEZ51_08945 [Pediococcus stilesii]|uniref:Uncharacterized protein n=1 Tax=Pediococcus stilesii TaxID=331679 RepID=A0A5R9BTH0_9LACO|nr:hypothetical protein [Pediococcus stilesii]TLQ03513.1 hypothetical protein FEZ51_08945 [Pediococcus stilesii]
MKKSLINFLKEKYFWIALCLVLTGIIVGLAGNDIRILRTLFFNKDGVFNWTILVGITGIYSFIFTVYLNAHRDDVELVVKPKIEHNKSMVSNLSDMLVYSANLGTMINVVVGDLLYAYYDINTKNERERYATKITEGYTDFLNVAESLLFEIDVYSDSTNLGPEIEKLRDNIQIIMRLYNNAVSRLDELGGKRKSMNDDNKKVKNLLIEDPENPGVFVSKEVREMKNNRLRPTIHELYIERKEIRKIARMYFKNEEKTISKKFKF